MAAEQQAQANELGDGVARTFFNSTLVGPSLSMILGLSVPRIADRRGAGIRV